ncbi:MAG: DUF805 domain-containing protein [Sutterella wadsworthensis]
MSIINDFKNEFRFSAHGRTSRRNFWIYQIGLFVLGLAVAMGCGTIIGLTNAVVSFWFIIAALLILPFGIANIFVTIRRLHDMGYSGTGISPSWLQACLPPLLIRSFPLPR